MSGDTIQINVNLTFREYLRAIYWYSWRRRRSTLPVMASFFAIVIAGTAAVWLVPDTKLGWPTALAWGGLLFTLLSPYLMARQVAGTKKGFFDNVKHSFSPEGITAVGDMTSGFTRWESINRAFETKHAFLLVFSVFQFLIIPKHCFESAEQIQAFKDLIRSSLGEKARLK